MFSDNDTKLHEVSRRQLSFLFLQTVHLWCVVMLL